MGNIKSQTIKGTIINYAGILIGFVTAAILSPRVDSRYIGLVSVIVSYAVIMSQIGGLGLGGITTRLFTYFRTGDNRHHGFLFLSVVITIAGFIISSLILVVIRYFFYFKRTDNDLFLQYYWFIIPVLLFILIFNLFDNYYRMLYNAVTGIFLKEFIQKAGTFLAVLMVVAGLVGYKTFVVVYLIGYSLPGIIMLIYALNDRNNHFYSELNYIRPAMKKAIVSVGLFSVISTATGIVAINIDKIMIEAFTGLSKAGVYTIAFYFGVIIAVPARSMLKIASAHIADAWKRKDTDTIKIIYHKSAVNLLVTGAFLVTALYVNLDNILVLLKGDYAAGKYVILLIAFAYLTDMAAGTAGQVLFTSGKYHYQSYLMIIYVLLIVITNWLLIPEYGINGAALATLISKFLINIIRFILIYFFFRFQPYNYKFLLILFAVFV
ncbi:MAG: oligosaccharide flippase family protein, partial [Chlorobi bacterium]|nr:oligosaccharide flippase family protein [Chlorobiota bacterium]